MKNSESGTDQRLLQQVAQGDERAFTAIYKKYYPALFLYAEKIIPGDQFLAQDATAEAFIELWKGKRNFENTAHLVGFLRAVVHNKCMDKFRKARREIAIQQELLHVSEQQEDALFDEIFLQAGILSRIQAEVEKLPFHTRNVFKLAFYHRLKNREIALRLHVKDSTVRRRKTEALHQLRQSLSGLDWGAWILFLYLFFQ